MSFARFEKLFLYNFISLWKNLLVPIYSKLRRNHVITYTTSINIPYLLYHIVSYHSKIVFDKEQIFKMQEMQEMQETGKVLTRTLFTRTNAYSY